MGETVHQRLLDQKGILERKEGGFWAWIRSMDAFPKFDVEYLRLTSSGGLGSLICWVVMGSLMVSEVWRWTFPPMQQEFVVDPSIQERIPIDFQISVATPCDALMVMMADENGQMRALNEEIEAEEILFPDPSSKKTTKKSQVWKLTDAEVARFQAEARAKAMDPSEMAPPEGWQVGCRLTGAFEVDRVDGRLMIMPMTEMLGIFGKIIMQGDTMINFSHIIHRMSFGKDYPGKVNPLNGSSQPAMIFHEDFTYFLSILPTRYQGLFGNEWIRSNQYSLTGFLGQKDPNKVEKPGLFFRIAIEPLSVVVRYPRPSLRKFFVHLVGILGGVYICFAIVTGVFNKAVDWLSGDYAGKKRRTSSLTSQGSVALSTIEPLLQEAAPDKEMSV